VTRGEYIRLLGNPYASIDVQDERDSTHQALFASQNPYATLYYSEDRVEIVAQGKSENPSGTCVRVTNREQFDFDYNETEQIRLSAAKFESECRAIFGMYRPLGQRILLVEHRRFIAEGRSR
jgi:hypothetical protein